MCGDGVMCEMCDIHVTTVEAILIFPISHLWVGQWWLRERSHTLCCDCGTTLSSPSSSLSPPYFRRLSPSFSLSLPHSPASGKKGGGQLNGQAAAGVTRKRKRRESAKENPLPPSSLSPPSLSPPSLSPPSLSSSSSISPGDSKNSGCQGDDVCCHGNKPKPCRVDHSDYSITMEVEPILMGSEVNSRTKVVITIAIPNSR